MHVTFLHLNSWKLWSVHCDKSLDTWYDWVICIFNFVLFQWLNVGQGMNKFINIPFTYLFVAWIMWKASQENTIEENMSHSLLPFSAKTETQDSGFVRFPCFNESLKYHYRPGTVALREIRKFQRNTDLLSKSFKIISHCISVVSVTLHFATKKTAIAFGPQWKKLDLNKTFILLV